MICDLATWGVHASFLLLSVSRYIISAGGSDWDAGLGTDVLLQCVCVCVRTRIIAKSQLMVEAILYLMCV